MLKKCIFIGFFVWMTVPLANGVYGEEKAVNSEPIIEDVAPIEVGNKICPVSGGKIGEMGEAFLYEYKNSSLSSSQSKFYSLCCEMCKLDFEKDPLKYSKIADEEVLNAAATAGESEELMHE